MMSNVTLSPEEIARRGQEYYEQFLKVRLEPEHKGKFLVVDIESRGYEKVHAGLLIVRGMGSKAGSVRPPAQNDAAIS